MRPRADRWAAASAGRSPRGRWAARRLFAAADGGDADARRVVAGIAGDAAHRLRDRAREAIAAWWAQSRDPELRRAVVGTGAVAAEAPARPLTLALLGRLGVEAGAWEARWAPPLLADLDPDVRANTAAFCVEATGPVLAGLWGADTGPGTPLRDVLLANGEAPAPLPLARLWEEWLDRPDGRLWEALSRWGRPAAGGGRAEALSVIALEPDDPVVLRDPRYRRALIDALAFGDHPLCGIAEGALAGPRDQTFVDELCAAALDDDDLAAVCRKHRLAPADPARRAVFFLLTGQPEQNRALDPDGALLGLAYTSAPAAERERMRAAMLAAGELDLVRVIVGEDRRARIPQMTRAEVWYLAEQLAGRREWDAVWAIVRDVPIATGAELCGLLDGWAPRGDDERRVFELYRKADPALLARAVEHLAEFGDRVAPRMRLRFRGRVNDVSFAPDGPFLAAAGTNRVAGVFDLRSAALVERYGGFAASVGRVLHLGDGALVAAERTNRIDRECRVVHCADGATRVLHTGKGSVTTLAGTGGGGFVAGTRAGVLLRGGPDGAERLPSARYRVSRGSWPRAIAAHPPSGRIAVLGRHLIVAPPDPREPRWIDYDAATAWPVFTGDGGALVCAERGGRVRRLRANPPYSNVLAETGTARFGDGVRGVGALPGGGEVVVVDGTGGLHVMDAGTLTSTTVHRAAEPGDPTSATVSPDGGFLAVGDAAGHTDLFDLRVREVPRIVRRPVVDLVPRHLGIVTTALATPALAPESAGALRLLEACLEHRFRFDVELGDAVALAGGEHDISL